MIDVWLLFGLMLPFLVFLLEVFFELVIQIVDKKKQEETDKVKNITHSSFEFSRSLKEVKSGCQINKVKKCCQIFIPIATIAFIIIYWSFALFHYYNYI